MKQLSILTGALLVAAVAHADSIKPATLDVTCTNPREVRAVRIVSTVQGSAVTVNGLVVLRQGQLTAGTEGGPAYLQAVGNGYNITLQGGDLVKAFNTNSTIRNGKATATIQWPLGAVSKAVCQGLYSFR